jgi:glycosyltransferase involved in cell wall biosynthesis
VRALALVAVYNEERFIGSCLDHLIAQGIDVYMIDNGSADRTSEIAERYVGRGLVGLERLPRDEVYSWRPILERKQELAANLDADWFLHVDADEIRPPPRPGVALVKALAEVEADGYNAVNFQEFTFVPTREAPDHDHPRFQETMRWYYPFLSRFPDQLRAWKRQEAPVDLASSGGHRVEFPGLRMHPRSFPMRHYLFLSVEHAIRKYVERRFDEAELVAGWHRARAALQPGGVTLLPESQLRVFTSDHELDSSNPWPRHPLLAGC